MSESILLEDACAIASRIELEFDKLVQPSGVDKAIIILYRAYLVKCKQFKLQSNELAKVTVERDEYKLRNDKIDVMGMSRQLAERVYELEQERDKTAKECLEALAGTACTPVEGYAKAGMNRIASDIRSLVKDYRKIEQERGELKEKVKYVENMGLHFGIMKTSDRPDGFLAHTWKEWSDHERLFREWADSIGWEDKVAKQTAEKDIYKLENEYLLDKIASLKADAKVMGEWILDTEESCDNSVFKIARKYTTKGETK